MSGGGAVAAYQVGVLSWIARHVPELTPRILTGVSAGGINATALAALPGDFAARVEQLRETWCSVTTEQVMRVDATDLVARVVGWGVRLLSGGARAVPHPRALVDTSPLRVFLSRSLRAGSQGALPGIQQNLERGEFDSLALTASCHTTGKSVTWVQGAELVSWDRAHRQGRTASITLDHVMASAALPLLFPSVEVEGRWYCDGGVRLTAPLSPAIHLGADKILAITVRYRPPEYAFPRRSGYPQPAEIVGDLLDAVFLDQFDADALRAERINGLLAHAPAEHHEDLRPLDLLVLRPSRDLSALANEFEPRLPGTLRFLTRGLGTKESRNNSLVSLLMFQPDYVEELLEIGRSDAEKNAARIEAFVSSGDG